MNRLYIVLLLSISHCVIGYGQNSADFGLITAEEAALKQCSFDPEAPAAVLQDEGYSDFDQDYGLITFYHKKIKILKEEGRKYGDVSIIYNSENGFEKVDELTATVINVDENGNRNDITLDRKSIFTKKLNKYRSEVTFAFPDVKVGSILEYKYKIFARNYGGLRDWDFQSDIPVYRSSYRLKIVPGHEVTYLVQYNQKYPVTVKPIKFDNAIFFEMKNIPGMSDEPYMDARQDYVQKVIFQTTKYQSDFGSSNFMSTWKEVTRELFNREDFGRQIRLNINECEDYIKASIAGKSDFEKMKLIHDYVISNVKWDGIYGIVAQDGIRSLWKKKSGNSGEVNLLQINLLKAAGLEVYPMLVSERGHGKVNKENPFISQFNNVFAAVFINGKKYYLDATDRYTPCHLIPFTILNSTAFIADNNNGGLIDIEEREIRYQDLVSISAHLTEDGELDGSVNFLSKDYAKTERLRNYLGDTSDYVDHYIKNGMGNISIDNFKVKDPANDTLPFQQTFDFKGNIQSTGDYSFLNINMFTGFGSNPFIINERFSNINFGYKKSVSLNFVIKVPKNFKIDAVPANIRLVNHDKTVVFTREIFRGEGDSLILARVRVDINKSVFGIDDYSQIKDFFKQMVGLMNEQVVLKKI